MRIHLKISTSKEILPFDHQPLLVGCIHKWLGENNSIHGHIALFSFSRLEGGKRVVNGLSFLQGATFFISAYSPLMIKQLIKGIREDPTMFNGFIVREIIMEEDPDFSQREKFFAASPIFISRRIGDKIEQILYDNPKSSEYLKETIQTKMKEAGLLIDNAFEIRFDPTYSYVSTKMITYNGIHNRASWCPVIIYGRPETKQFIWNVGLGNSTGIGLGAIK